MKVKYSYLEDQFADYQLIFDRIAAEVIKTGDYTLGKAVGEFEEIFAELQNGQALGLVRATS